MAVLGQHRFLHEQRVQRGEFGEDAAGGGGGEAAVAVDGDIAVRAECLAGGGDAGDDRGGLGGGGDR